MHIEHRTDTKSYARHAHAACEMLYIVSGRSRITVCGECLEAGADWIVYFNHLEEHETVVLEEPYERVFVMLAPDEADTALGYLTSVFRSRVPGFSRGYDMRGAQANMRALFRMLADEPENGDETAEKRKRTLLWLIQSEVLRMYPKAFDRPDDDCAVPVTQIQAELDKRFAEPFSVEALAERYHVSAGYLSRRFHQRTGFSPMQYVTLNRLSAARSLLCSTNITVTQAALQCGFRDVNNFIRCFSNRYGITPKQMQLHPESRFSALNDAEP